MPENAEKQHDTDATIPMAAPVPTACAKESPDLPLPEELTLLLPHGNYSVDGFLGQGGMGAVYKGTQVRLQRQVAIKIMRRDQGKDHGFEERFRREALALAQLNHPNIVNVIDYGEAGPDYLYIVMEFVDGTDLVGVIRSGEMTQETALKLLPQICDALQFAHDNGIVHRDIKPANILLTRDGRIKMADFGLAKRFDVNSSFHTQTGTGMGTPDYAAPEQFDPHGNVDHRADIYALGVMIYQMITGHLPRGAWKPPSEKADVDAHWDKIVSHALQTDPSDRYASVSEIKTDISSITAAPGGPGGVTGSVISRKSGFSGKLGGSTTVLTQAGGRSVTVVQAPAPPRSKKPLVFGLTGALMIAAGGYFAWNKFPAEVRPIFATNPVASAAPATPVTVTVTNIPQRPVPKPAAWVDVTPQVRDAVVQAGAGAVQGDWLVLSKSFFTPLTDNKIFRNAVLRMSFKGVAGMTLRERSEKMLSYQCYLVKGVVRLHGYNGAANAIACFNQARSLDAGFDLLAEHEMVMAAEGDLISLWLDGRLMLSQRDSTIAQGRIGVTFTPADAALLPHVRKVEYADLGDTPVTPVEVAKPAPPAPIRIWDAADKIPKQPGVSWDDDALRLDKAAVAKRFPTVHRVAVKTSIRVNPDTVRVTLGMGKVWGDPALYMLNVNFQTASLDLLAREGLEKTRTLGSWKLPRQYRPGEWLPLDLRVSDGEISLSLDGKLLGTVHDSTYSEFTFWGFSGKSSAHFRDVEVVPLDPSWSNQPQAAPSFPASVMVTDIPQRPVPKPAAWVDATPQVRDAVVQAGAGAVQGDWLVLSKAYHNALPDGKTLRDAVVRMTFKGVAGMALRHTQEELSYQCWLMKGGVRLHGYNGAADVIACLNHSRFLDAGFDLLAEHELVMAAEGDLISVWLDGQLMLSQRDSTIPHGRISLDFSTAGADASHLPHVKKVEYADLGGGSAVSAPALSSSTTATKDAPFINTLGMTFVPVPITGGPTDGKRVLFSVWETRVQDYEAFVKETKRVWTKPAFEQAPEHPAVDMSWDDAMAFCAWLTDREHKAGKLGATARYRLPADHEWSSAVGIAPQEDAAKSPAQKDRALAGLYPWGTVWPPPANVGNYAGEEMIPAKISGRHPHASPCMGYRDAYVETAPAGSFPANALGLHDLGGSVWEWCEEWYDDSKNEHILRGGAYIAGDQDKLLSSTRNPYRPTSARSIYFGFRCVLVPDEVK